MGQLPKTTQALFVVFALVAIVALVVVYGQRCSGGGQYAQIGQEIKGRLEEGTVPGSYAFVADYQTKQYWPNKPRYVEDIPQERRVYILDQAALDEFKGYEPGPL